MASSYPATKQTFTNPVGTQTLDTPDHAGLHGTMADTLGSIQDTIGTNSGTNILMHFTAGQFPVRATGVTATGTLQQTLAGGTYNSYTSGTPNIVGGSHTSAIIGASGGTLNNITVGTPAVTGGTLNNITVGTPAITGGTYISPILTTPAISTWRGTVLRNDNLATTTNTNFTNITNGSVSAILDTAGVLDISFTMWSIKSSGGGAQQVQMVINGTNDSTVVSGINWDDNSGIQLKTFRALRTGFAAGTHTVNLQWKVASTGTVVSHRTELVVIPTGTA